MSRSKKLDNFGPKNMKNTFKGPKTRKTRKNPLFFERNWAIEGMKCFIRPKVRNLNIS